MSKLYFSNEGEFDIRAMLTFGMSAKGSEDAIGYFGTGFKYAVAIILRLGGSIKIETNGKRYKFVAKNETVRGEKFQVVYMNDREAGFTTRLGINWEPWMAFRELYCNCMDEGGSVSEKRADAETVITVNCPAIEAAYRDRDSYFLSGTPIVQGAEAEIYDSSRPYIFYKGVAVARTGKRAIYSYNLTRHVDLTEDRTLKHDYQSNYAIQKALQNSASAPMLRKAFSTADSFESTMGFDSDWGASEAFISVVRELIHSDIGAPESARRLVAKLDEKSGNWPALALTPVQERMLSRAVDSLANINVDIERFPVQPVSGLGTGVMGRAMDGVIYLSELPFHMGTKQVASTLLEEWVHNKYGCKDFDRNMQSWLFDKVLSLGEELMGEPI